MREVHGKATDTAARRKKTFRAVALSASLLLCLPLGELMSRWFWRSYSQVPFREPSKVLFGIYPELREPTESPPRADDETIDILFLGGSVLSDKWGSVPVQLLERLAERGIHGVRLVNLARPAHSTRDSLLKYRALGSAHFDLIVVYHGVNDVRANNAPADVYRDDYSHIRWYKVANLLGQHHGRSDLALSYTVPYVLALAAMRSQPDRHTVLFGVRPDWVKFGSEIRSATAFEANLDAIVELAAQRDVPVLLQSFALHVPEDYSPASFENHELAYRRHLIPLELWGEPTNVAKGVAAHNEVIVRVAAEHDGVRFVDQAALLDGSAENFDDACHLTTPGASAFVDNMIEQVLAALGESTD